MAKVKKITGYDEFIATIDQLTKSAENVNVLFTGKKDNSGRSWCPDCNDGKMHLHLININKIKSLIELHYLLLQLIHSSISIALKKVTQIVSLSSLMSVIVQRKCVLVLLLLYIRYFLIAAVQLLCFSLYRWKDIKNSFRLDRNTHLSVIPTLINWKEKAKRLEGDQLCKPELFDIYLEQD